MTLRIDLIVIIFHAEAAEAETTTATIISPEILERLLTAPKFRTTYNSLGTMRCVHCQCSMESNTTIIQWEWLRFCNSMCFQSFISKTSVQACPICSNDCDFYCELPCANVYGNRLYVFCSEECTKKFFNLAPFCQYCRQIVDPEKMLNDSFCHAICQQKFDAFYDETSSTIKEICCIECSLATNANIRLLYAGRIYGFCSHRCYFYRTLLCALFPGMYKSFEISAWA